MREAELPGEFDLVMKLRKMSWPERKVRRWWMQRDLWKSYKKALKLMWADYEGALAIKNKEMSDQLFIQMLQFRKVFEEGRAAIDAAFETKPKKVPEDGREKGIKESNISS